MPRIDCSTVVGFAQEAYRFCNMYEKRDDCPFSGKKKCLMAVLEYDKPNVQAMVDDLQKWSDENPVKTRLDDLQEKYPGVIIEDDGHPIFYPSTLGYCNNCHLCKYSDGDTRKYCWHEPVDGGATGKAVE